MSWRPTIEKGVPIPDGKRRSYPWREMEIDDSFFVKDGNLESMRATAYGAHRRYGMKFKVRQVDGGVRIWRVA